MALEFESPNKDQTPPGGWDYTQPETGSHFNGYAYTRWLDQIRTHRFANDLPISADFNMEMDDQLVKRHPEWVQMGIARRIKHDFKVRRFSFAGTLGFLKMLYNWNRDGRPMVDQSEAERRARICETCPYNQKLSFGCGACFSTVMEWIAKIRGDRQTPQDENLGSCGICSCSLKASIHFPIEAQTANLSDEIKADLISIEHCWKGKELRDLS